MKTDTANVRESMDQQLIVKAARVYTAVDDFNNGKISEPDNINDELTRYLG